MTDTIFALSSGMLPAALGVVRVSGPVAGQVVERLTGTLPEARRATLRTLRDAQGAVLDRALVLWLPGPATATGEDLAELHCHGGRAVIAAVSAAITAILGCRPAEAGEFTRRALIHGRIDLTEAEGLADLLAAQTEQQRRTAIDAAGGALRRHVERWAGALNAVSAMVEAELDYGDEADVVVAPGAITHGITTLLDDLDAILRLPGTDGLHTGFRVVFGGPTNRGKSSLFNLMAGREAAIVSDIAGTTRDVLLAPVSRAGLPFILIDTAGLTETDDPVERIGVARARDAAAAADILLWFGEDRPDHPRAIWLAPRSDIVPMQDRARLPVSIHDPASLTALWDRLAREVAGLLPPEGAAFNERQRALIGTAATALKLARNEDDLLLVAEHLRAARNAFAAITGHDATEAMLDSMFARFCVGK